MTSPPPTPPPRWLVVGGFVLLTVIWGTTWAVIRVGLRGMPPFTGVSLRFAIAGALLFALAPVMKVRFGTHPHERRLWLILGCLSFCGSYGIVYWSEQWVPSGLASVLFATFPLLVAILAHLFLPGERMTRAGAIGVLVGFAGVAVVFSEDFTKLGGPGVARGAVVFLGSPIVSSIAYVCTKKWGKGIHPLSLSAPPMVFTAVVMGIVALLVERDRPVTWTGESLGALFYLAVAGTALTFTVYYWLLSFLPATRLSLMAYLIPVVAVILGATVFDEPLTAKVVAGSALVVVGVALAGRRNAPTDEP